jgi:nitroreductase
MTRDAGGIRSDLSDREAIVDEPGMSFREAVEGRCSVRRFGDAPVPREDAREMVRLATRAANAANAQMWRFVAVESPAVRMAMLAAVEVAIDAIAAWPEADGREREIAAIRRSSTFFAGAPLVFAVAVLPYASHADRLLAAHGCAREECDRLRQRPDIQSVGAALQLLVTAAHAMGYGSCWMSAPVLAAERLERLLEIEPPAQVVALVPVGSPGARPRSSKRLPVGDVLRFA